MLTFMCDQELEKLEGLTVEKQDLTLIPEDLGLECGREKNGLSLDNLELKQLNEVSSKNVWSKHIHITVISCILSVS